MASLGQELKKKREESGITLHQIADATHIGVRFLQALENDDYSILPGGVFNRAFVRKFAKQVGMEEATALRLYDEQLASSGGEADRRFVMGVDDWDQRPTSGNGLLLSFVALIILSAGAYLAYSYFYAAKDEAGTTPATVVPTPVATPPATPTPEPSPTPNLDELRLQVVTGTGACWIKVVRDAAPAEEALLQPGETREFVAKEKLLLNVGNLPSVRLTLNGRLLAQSKLGMTPTSVVAKNVVLTKENYLQFVE